MTITRAHLEEDTAKLVHATDAAGRRVSLVDFNRSGAPLMEIVTEPDIRTAEQARRYAEELQLLLRSIGASDADMERGQLRVEANVSLRPRGTEPFGTRVEVKNMNSFRAVERAIAFEIERQAAILDAGEPLVQETRGWSEERGSTYRMRVKETSDDYRYFPEPDLPPLHLDPAWLAELRDALPELPGARRRRYREVVGLTEYDADVLVADPEATELFEATLAADPALDAKAVANWVLGDFLRLRNAGASAPTIAPAELAAIIAAVHEGSISRAQGREVLDEHAATGQGAAAIIAARGFRQISDTGALTAVVDEVLADNPAAVADYRAGKVQAVGFLVGQVMKATRGQANAALAQARSASASSRRRPGRPERVSALNVALWVGGAVLIVIGYTRARAPWSRYQALKAQDRNVARYEAWRGGVRDDSTTGASVAMAILRRQAQTAGLSRSPGSVLVFLGFLVRCPRIRPPLDLRAAVHHHGQPAFVRDPGGLPADDAELQPAGTSPRRPRPRGRAGHRTPGAAEDVDHARTARSRRPLRRACGKAAMPGHLALVGVDRHAVEPLVDEVPEDIERRPGRVGRSADDRDPPRRPQDLARSRRRRGSGPGPRPSCEIEERSGSRRAPPPSVACLLVVRDAVGSRRDRPANDPGEDDDREDVGQHAEDLRWDRRDELPEIAGRWRDPDRELH